MKPSYVGLAVAGLYIIFKMVLFIAGIQNTVMVNSQWSILLILVLIGIFYSINQYIRSSTGYDWMAAFKKGLTVALVAGVIAGIFLYIYYSAIDTYYLELRQVEWYNQFKGQIPKDQMEESQKSMKAAFRPTTYAVVTVSIVNILGLLGSLVVALIGRFTIKRK